MLELFSHFVAVCLGCAMSGIFPMMVGYRRDKYDTLLYTREEADLLDSSTKLVFRLLDYRTWLVGLVLGTASLVPLMIWTEWPHTPDLEDLAEWAGSEIAWLLLGAAVHFADSALIWRRGRNDSRTL